MHNGAMRGMGIRLGLQDGNCHPANLYSDSLFAALLLHEQLVRHQRDELTVGGLVVFSIDIEAEERVQVFDLRI